MQISLSLNSFFFKFIASYLLAGQEKMNDEKLSNNYGTFFDVVKF